MSSCRRPRRARARRCTTSLLAALALLVPCGAATAAADSPSQAVNQDLEQAASVDLAQVSLAQACPPADPGYATCQATVLRLRAGGGLLHPSARRGRPLQTVSAALARGGQLAAAAGGSGLAAGAPGTTLTAGAPGTSLTAGAPGTTISAAEQAAQSAPGAYTAAWLQQAYDLEGLSATGGIGDTVAIVDAFDDPTAESDLAVFRSSNGLPPCTTANGCFEKVNEGGQTSGPTTTSWNLEESLDLDAVSALCPNCHLLLVEASSASLPDLLSAMATAARMGAKQISDSWSAPASGPIPGTFTWAGVATIAASGDDGYVGPGEDDYPAALTGVTAAGGTSLASSATLRGFTETAWTGSGSGCDVNETKPAYQPSGGCAGRAWVDVSADADPNTGLGVYDPGYGYGGDGWLIVGGTSLATPLVAAFEAVSGVSGATPQWAYSDSGLLNDPSSGSNGSCAATIAYICNAGTGYDGPTGAGSISGAVTAGAPGIGAPDLSSASGATYVQSVGGSTATLQAGVYPNGNATTAWWEYGTTSSYGYSTAPAAVGAGTAPVAVTSTLSGLAPSTGYHFRLVVQNSAGTTYGYDYTLSTGAGSTPISGSAPVNTALPAISGTPQRLAMLTATPGERSPAATDYAYQWLRCPASGGSCTSISGATSSSYTPLAEDEGAMLSVQVTASSDSGQQTATSAQVGPVSANPPVDGTPPTIAAAATTVGSQLAAGPGTWSPADVSYGYQWQDCLAATCSDIAQGTGATYTIEQADTGEQVRVLVTATNVDGSASASSAAITVTASQTSQQLPSQQPPTRQPPTRQPPRRVSPPRPVAHLLPRLASDPGRVGDTLHAMRGSWVGSVTARSDQFVRCTSKCVPVGSPGLSYKLVAADAGASIRVRETAVGPGGTTSVYSTRNIGPVRAKSAVGAVAARGEQGARNAAGRK